MTQVIDALIRIRDRDGLTDVALAKQIKCHHVNWAQFKSGKRKLNYSFLQKVVRAYPEVAPAIVNDLFDGDIEKAREAFKNILREM